MAVSSRAHSRRHIHILITEFPGPVLLLFELVLEFYDRRLSLF
jgi:hypothetical protein